MMVYHLLSLTIPDLDKVTNQTGAQIDTVLMWRQFNGYFVVFALIVVLVATVLFFDLTDTRVEWAK